MWIALIGGALNCWLLSREPIAAAILAAFTLFAGWGVRHGSFFKTVGLLVALSVFATWQSVSSADFTLAALVWTMTAFGLTGALKAAWVVSYGSRSLPLAKSARCRTALSNTLFVCFGLFSFMAAFPGSFWERDEITGFCSMEPGLYLHDQVISLKIHWFGSPHRGSVVAFLQPGNGVVVARVVGIPGDQIQVRAGKLIRNGKIVVEPYCQVPYSEKMGDFPLPAQAFPPGLARDVVAANYGDTLNKDQPFVVPEGAYFVLNDNRNGLYDSRRLGPLRQETIVGPVIFAYDADHRWRHPKFVH